MRKNAIIAIIVFCAQVFAQIGGVQVFPHLMPQQMQPSIMNMPSISPTTIMAGGTLSNDALLNSINPNLYSGTDLYIDENAYFLGSGDILRAVIWGVGETVISITVAGETVIIPSVGAIDVGFVTLNEAKKEIIAKIKNKYKTDRVDVFLEKVKDVSVQVQGHVNFPNTYIISGNLTIPSILEQIGGTAANANLRAIQLIHPKYGTRIVDVMKTNRIVDYPATNLRSGDRIFVPQRDLRVSISGEVHFSGDYDFIPGDKLSDLIKLSGGMFASADSSRIIVTRFVGQNDEIRKITLTAADADNFALEKDDIVLVSRKSEYRPVRRVSITGEVKFPGTYSIRETHTRLIDIIELAGGLTEQAFLGGSKIVRRNFIDPAARNQHKLQNRGNVQITPADNNFLKYRTNGETQVNIDFVQLNLDKNSIENIILKAGDEIHIARNSWTVNVMGGVLRPGLVEFSPGKDLAYYIEQAGGYKKDAVRRKVRVVKAGSEVWLRPNQVTSIEQGDAIWIPERDFVEKQEKQQNVSIVGGILGIAGSVATIITAAITVIAFVER